MYVSSLTSIPTKNKYRMIPIILFLANFFSSRFILYKLSFSSWCLTEGCGFFQGTEEQCQVQIEFNKVLISTNSTRTVPNISYTYMRSILNLTFQIIYYLQALIHIMHDQVINLRTLTWQSLFVFIKGIYNYTKLQVIICHRYFAYIK